MLNAGQDGSGPPEYFCRSLVSVLGLTGSGVSLCQVDMPFAKKNKCKYKVIFLSNINKQPINRMSYMYIHQKKPLNSEEGDENENEKSSDEGVLQGSKEDSQRNAE